MDKESWKKRGVGHRERLRNRFLERGLGGFTDSEVLELLLSFGTPRKDCKQAARALLEEFGNFPAVLDAKVDALRVVDGVGPKNSFAIAFIKSVAERYLKQRINNKRFLQSSDEVYDFLSLSMRGLQVEILTVIYLDSSHCIIDSEIVAEGTVNVSTVYPREIVKRALQKNAAALVVAHNHPSGSIKPSQQDYRLTRNLCLLCSMMNMRLLDHIIVGEGHFSFADHGAMASSQDWANRIIMDDAADQGQKIE